jgi:hypothetical protein
MDFEQTFDLVDDKYSEMRKAISEYLDYYSKTNGLNQLMNYTKTRNAFYNGDKNIIGFFTLTDYDLDPNNNPFKITEYHFLTGETWYKDIDEDGYYIVTSYNYITKKKDDELLVNFIYNNFSNPNLFYKDIDELVKKTDVSSYLKI